VPEARRKKWGITKPIWDTDEHSAAQPQPKILYWTQINTNSIFAKDLKTKDVMGHGGTRINTDYDS
jgi:hypothetical protein